MSSAIGLMLASLAAARLKHHLRRTIILTALVSTAVTVAVAGLCLLIAAMWIAIANSYSAIIANIAIGVGLLCISFFLYAYATLTRARPIKAETITYHGQSLGRPPEGDAEGLTMLKTVIVLAGTGYIFGRIIARK